MRWLLSFGALLLLTNAVPAQAGLPALARPVPACDRPQLDRFQLFWQRDRTPAPVPYDDLEIRDILRQWPGVLRRLDRLELGLRADPYAVPRDPYLPVPRVDPYVPRDPYLPRGEICPRCPPAAPAPRVDPYAPRVDPYLPRVDPYLPRDYLPPAVAAPNGYQRYQGANAVRR